VVDDDKRAAILARRGRGESIRTIAEGVGVSVGVVHKTLTDAEIPKGLFAIGGVVGIGCAGLAGGRVVGLPCGYRGAGAGRICGGCVAKGVGPGQRDGTRRTRAWRWRVQDPTDR
jgi:hypothetical protein